MILLAAACVDESDHLTLVNAGDEEVVSQEGGREGSAAGGEEGLGPRSLRVLLRLAFVDVIVHELEESGLTPAAGRSWTPPVPHTALYQVLQ